MPMIRRLYPKDWQTVSEQVKWAARYKCESCGVQCRRPGEAFDTHKRTLTCAHRNHKPWDCSRENLIALCAPCHLLFDSSHNQLKRWFQSRIDGDQGHVGVQLHLFVAGIKIGRIIHDFARKLRPAVPGEGDTLRQVRDDLVQPE